MELFNEWGLYQIALLSTLGKAINDILKSRERVESRSGVESRLQRGGESKRLTKHLLFTIQQSVVGW